MTFPRPLQFSHSAPSFVPLPLHSGQTSSPVDGVPGAASSPGFMGSSFIAFTSLLHEERALSRLAPRLCNYGDRMCTNPVAPFLCDAPGLYRIYLQFKREPDPPSVHFLGMTTNSQPRPLALILVESAPLRSFHAKRLEHAGYDVRCFQTAWDALSMFGDAMPETCIIGSARRTPCLDLLIDDLNRYGIPIRWVGPAMGKHVVRDRVPVSVGTRRPSVRHHA